MGDFFGVGWGVYVFWHSKLKKEEEFIQSWRVPLQNVSPFKPVPLLPPPEEGEEPLVLEHWSRLDWTPADIYGGEEATEDGGPVVLPEAKLRPILKKVTEGECGFEDEGEEEFDWKALEPPRCSHDRRVAFDIRPEDPREQQPPHPRPQLRRPADT